jgi:hypothetical protein
MPAIKKSAYKTSFLSDIQATDSTCKGCMAKRRDVTNAISGLLFESKKASL